ncbi:MAG: N-acetylmuramoyl-L-alanine amidase [Defluviitaleaceae bacterium]|nr:N-acetylmuramoyl-L-alanine amidase [Defluviitaleaceae bacterium]MCL2837307.1 N-acetylmuramoyl-L-alanine amidase [Defluviitaleaceae bacterium]
MKRFIYVIIYLFLFLLIQTPCVYAGMPANKRVITIDAGHGEWDPGKQNRSVDEKDINLAISEKLQTLFELGGAVVFTTRSDDTALADRKREDLRARAEIANKAGADVFISIHQNSFESEAASGAQVFYHSSSENSKILAELIQERFNAFVGGHGGNPGRRQAKPSEIYYVLKKTDMPAVIVECGFMSNSTDLKLLQDEHFQDKIAWAVYMGVSDYFGKIRVRGSGGEDAGGGVK